jgi:hypothetical protein
LTSGVAFDGAVHGRAPDAEQVGQLSGAVVTGVMQRDEVSFLAGVELGLLAAQAAFGLGHAHALFGA